MRLSRIHSELRDVWINGRVVPHALVRWYVERHGEADLKSHIGRLSPAAQEEDYLTDIEIGLVRQMLETEWQYDGPAVVIDEVVDSTSLRRFEELCLDGHKPLRERWRRGEPCITLTNAPALRSTPIKGLLEVIDEPAEEPLV